MHTVSKGNIPRLYTLVSISHKAGDSIHTILEKIDKAVHDVYCPLSYRDQDYQQVFLFHKLGGVMVAELAHQIFGLPSIDMTCHHIITCPLTASPKFPTLKEMLLNLRVAFLSDAVPAYSQDDGIYGIQIMIDELKLETRMQWDAKSNTILGLCREHSKHIEMKFLSMTQAVTIQDVLTAKKLHLASEVHASLSPHTTTNWLTSYQATIITVGILAKNPHLYGAQPFMISGMDKTEDVPSQMKLIGTAMNAVSLKSKDIHGILYSIALDGDSRQRLTAVKLTMKTTISANSPLWSILGDLELFNYECGENEETMDIEYKHLLKHLQNTVIHAKCTTINGVVLTSQVLKHHLLSLRIKDE